MGELIQILMERDGLSRYEAEEQINEFRNDLFAGELGYDAEEAFMEEFSLEPDYLVDILF